MPDADPPDPAPPEKPAGPALHGLDPAELLGRALHTVNRSADGPEARELSLSQDRSNLRAPPVLQTEALVFVDGQEVARRILGPGAHIFGVSDDCGVQITADLVSPRHAQLTIGEDGALLLEDLDSANGTFLDGQRIDAPMSVAPNQIIQIGAAQIILLQRTAGAFEDVTVVADGATAPSELSETARYEIGAEIAKGGMGAVLTARQPAIRREVALKVMLRNASAHDRLRFIEEAQITGQLEHPNIVPVHDLAFNEHGQPYYTMKLVKGSTLRDILKLLAQGDSAAIARYSLATLLTIFQKVCDAVAFAHARGVIHRDLKPANIMVGEFGEVLVMDWGLAKVMAGRNGSSDQPASAIVSSAREDQREVFATLNGAVMGTPHYMSPEQARGEVATLDQRSDIFSLGAILYELVTLLPPFPGKTTREILSNIKSGHFTLPNARLRAADTPHPRHLPAGVIPDSLEAVISKALTIDQNQRYQRVAGLQADLTAYQGGFATSAENASAWKQFTLLIKRHRALSTAVAASFLLIAGITAAFTTRVVAERNRTAVQRDRAQAGEQAAVKERNRAEAERTKAVAANAESLRHLHDASMADYAVARQRMEKDNRLGEGVAHLARALDLEPKNPLPAIRLYGTIAFGALDKTNLLRRVLPHESPVLSARFSADGARIVTTSQDKTAQVWDAATGQPLGAPLPRKEWIVAPIFSPDGTRIVTAGFDNIARVWDAATGQPLGDPMRHGAAIISASFSPNNALIVTTSYDYTARLWDAATGRPIGDPMLHNGWLSQVDGERFSPDSTRIVTVSEDRTAHAWEAATGQPIGNPMRHEEKVNSVVFSPDGTQIATTSRDKTARLWDAATGQPLGEPMRHENWVLTASFSPDGARMVTTSEDHTVRVWDAATTKSLGEPMPHDGRVVCAIFSPDSARIVTASENTARLWDAATGKPIGAPMLHDDRVVSALFSPDGARIITASEDGAARLWDAATGKPIGEPMRHDGRVVSASFSPDGTRIVTAGDDKTAIVWDAATGQPPGEPVRHEDAVLSASFSPDGARIVTASDDKTARVWDAATGRPLGEPMRHENWVVSASFSPDGARIVTASWDKTARLWDAATGQPLGAPMTHENWVNSALFSPDGARVLTASYDKTARLWDAATGQPLGAPMTHGNTVLSARFSSNGARIVTASEDKTARLWNAVTGKPFGAPMRHAKEVVSASFSPDGTRIVTASWDKTARLWDAATGQPLGDPVLHDKEVVCASFSPDGTRVVTTSDDNTAQLCDAATGQPLGDPMLHGGKVLSASFSPDGARLVTASNDNTARVWDAATGKPLGDPMPHEDSVNSASFSPDGARIVTASKDHTARVWNEGAMYHLPTLTPEWVHEWARAFAGWRFDADGMMQPMRAEERARILYTPHEGDDPWARLARWAVTDAATRTTDLISTHTCREIAERERDFGSEASLESALLYDSTVPLARLMSAKFEENPKLASFLRDYDLKRLPDDPALWERAARSLHEQKDDTRARQALQKLGKLAPKKAAALGKELAL